MKNSQACKHFDGSEIAIIGLAGRFPGAQNIEAFWRNLRDGVESVTFFTDEQLQASGVGPDVLHQANYVKARPVLEDVDLFDASFFGFSPREAAAMDPQHRLFLECVWEAIERAGYDVDNYDGAISVCAGVSMSTYLVNNLYANPEAMALAGEFESYLANTQDSLTTRIAYKLNLKGACYTVQTFCSTSLVATHMACQGLLNFECDMAVAGGVTVFVPQNSGYWYQEGLIVSPDGHCRPFDAKAQGTIFGNGLGAVVLKRLEEALADGDHIEAVILGSATNNDGSLKVSYAAPSVAGQAEVIVEAMANAGIEPESITYVETHGTGTALGDPTEIAALTRAFRSGTQKNGFCAIGSVKSNLGHLDAAGGVAGLIKTILALKHKAIPPSLNFETPNPEINFANSPFYVNSKLSDWHIDGTPRRAGVSAFGVGGTNAHVIVQEPPAIELSSNSRPYQLLVLSAKTNSALETATKNLLSHFKQYPELNLADTAYTLLRGRKHFNHRRMLVCQDISDGASVLEAAHPKRMLTVYQERRDPPIAFMLSGQGAQYVNMGLELYRTESRFREEIDRCSEILQLHLSLDLKDVLYPTEKDVGKAEDRLKQTSITQPALFTIEYALAKLWESWGVHPEALVGHSIGEYVAACLAGVFSLEEGLLLVATRARLMQELPAGSMLAVFLPEREIRPFLGRHLSLAAVNGPTICTVSGDNEAIAELEKELFKKNGVCRRLHTSHAFHSEMMDPILETFAEHVKRVRLQPPQIPFLSNLTGTWITEDEAINPGYWAKHLRQTVRFSDCLRELLEEPKRVFLEVGPGRTLITLAKQHLNKTQERPFLASLRHPKEQKSDVAFILNTLGQLWLAGIQVDWSGFYADEKRHRIPLPTYPFERKRHWVEPAQQPQGFPASQAGLTQIGGNTQHSDTSDSERGSSVPRITELQSDLLVARDPRLQSDYVAPRNEVEQSLVEIWQKLLGVEEIGVRDNYFDLGGDSIIAVRMTARIAERFNRKLPMATLYEAPTVEELASILGKEEWSATSSSLVAIQPTGSKPPFFCVHPHGGNVMCYFDLAHHLGPDQPFYGLRALDLDEQPARVLLIADMAAHYIEEIRTIQPQGPYFLGGWCMGGHIALEMAQLLRAEGEEVALLVMIQTIHPSYPKYLPHITFLHRKIFRTIERVDYEMSNLRELALKSKLSYFWRRFIHAMGLMQVKTEKNIGSLLAKCNLTIPHSLVFRVKAIEDAHDKAFDNYDPSPYQGRVAIFRTTKQPLGIYSDPTLGWSELIEGQVELHEVTGHHIRIFSQSSVQILAEKLKSCLNKAQDQSKPLGEIKHMKAVNKQKCIHSRF